MDLKRAERRIKTTEFSPPSSGSESMLLAEKLGSYLRVVSPGSREIALRATMAIAIVGAVICSTGCNKKPASRGDPWAVGVQSDTTSNSPSANAVGRIPSFKSPNNYTVPLNVAIDAVSATMEDPASVLAMIEKVRKNSVEGQWTYITSPISQVRFPGAKGDSFMFIEGESTPAMISISWVPKEGASTFLVGGLGIDGYRRMDTAPVQVKIGEGDGQMVRYQGDKDCITEVEFSNGENYYYLFFRGRDFGGPGGAFDRTMKMIKFDSTQ